MSFRTASDFYRVSEAPGLAPQYNVTPYPLFSPLSHRRAQPYSPTADDLNAFSGRYESTEIGSVFQIEPKGDGLLVRLEHTPSRSLEFKPVDRDTFQVSRVTVRFQRDKAGKIVALDYSNPLLRSVKFTRLTR